MIFAYGHRGNHHDRVPCGTSVMAAYDHDWLQKLHREMHKNRPDLFRDGQLILHNNACLHLGKFVTDLLSKYEWELLPYVPYRPDIIPPDFDLFHNLKDPWHGHRFSSLKEVSAAFTLSHLRTEQKWYPKWNSKSSEMLGCSHLRNRGTA
jgi:hypothetical protein